MLSKQNFRINSVKGQVEGSLEDWFEEWKVKCFDKLRSVGWLWYDEREGHLHGVEWSRQRIFARVRRVRLQSAIRILSMAFRNPQISTCRFEFMTATAWADFLAVVNAHCEREYSVDAPPNKPPLFHGFTCGELRKASLIRNFVGCVECKSAPDSHPAVIFRARSAPALFISLTFVSLRLFRTHSRVNAFNQTFRCNDGGEPALLYHARNIKYTIFIHFSSLYLRARIVSTRIYTYTRSTLQIVQESIFRYQIRTTILVYFIMGVRPLWKIV